MLKSLSSALAFVSCLAFGAEAVELPGPLVSTEWLAKNQEQVLIIDVRNDDASYKQGGHIIGAIPLDFRKARGKAIERGVELEDMNIPAAAFTALVRAAGISKDQPVVLTHRGRGPDDTGYAAYVYWQLKYFGHDKVALLDGGTTKWVAENREVWGEEETAKTGNFEASSTRTALLADTALVEKFVKDKSGDVLDARFFSFYVGLDKRPAIPKAGHIPGATLFSFDANFNPDGTFRPKDQLSAGYTAVGLSPARPVTTYCNTGHVSAISWFVLSEVLGYKNVTLYDGSMLAWARHNLPAETRLK